MTVDTEYGAVLRSDWTDRVVRDRHPLDGSHLYRVDEAPPTGEPLILLHGVGNDGGMWAPIMPSLAEHGPVLAPTMSPRLLSADDVAVRAETIDPLVEWLTAITPPPWRIVGHSMGGVVTGLLLRARPELVQGAVLINAPLPGVTHRIQSGDTFDRTGRALVMLRLLAQLTRFGRPRLPRFLRGPELAVVRTALRGFVADPGALDGRVISRAIMSTRTSDGMEFLRLARQLPVWHGDPFTGVPVHILLGGDDPLVPVEDLADVAAAYPAAEIEVLPGCGHFALLELPGDTVRAIDEFFARV
jgi:pimeloyl-ACP methyl ester carboxylesterase